MADQNKKLILVGCGNMGRAMLEGWLESGVLSKSDAYVIEPSDDLRTLAQALGAQAFKNADDLPEDVAPDFVVLAVKPQIMADAAPAYAKFANAGVAMISLAAGVTCSTLEALLGADAAISRVMPNTPAAISKGMMVIFNNANISKAQSQFIETLLAASGAVAMVDEEAQMDAVTAVSGSGPAYIFHMIEALHQAGIEAGLPEPTAKLLAEQTVYGAACYAKQSDTPPGILREQVTSPGGTTAAALDVLMNDANGLTQLMTRSVAAAKARSEELGR